MKRRMSFVLAVVFIFSMLSFSSVALAATASDVSITCFENYTINEGSLTATKSENVAVRGTSEATLTATTLNVTGQGVKGEAFDISVPIQNGAFVSPVDNEGNYDVLSVIDLSESIRIILKEKDARNMLYVDTMLNSGAVKRVKYESYNINWYRAFIGGTIVLEEEIVTEPTRSSTYSIIKLYSTTNNIYGDVYKEYIRVIAIQTYPQTINNSTGGSFYFTLGIKDKWTDYTPYGGSLVRTDDCSLGMNCGEINLSTPTGEYFASMRTDFVGEIYNYNNPLSLGFNLNIPRTPFSITYSYSYTEDGYGRSYYKSYPATTNKATQVGNLWEGAGYWTYKAATEGNDVGDYFYVEMKVDTDTTYQVLGSKLLNFKWDYHITGTGINEEYGLAVNMPSIYDSIVNTVSYTLTAAT